MMRWRFGLTLGCVLQLLSLPRAVLAQTTGESVSPAVVAISAIVGSIAGLVLLSLIVSHARKQYAIWRETRGVREWGGAEHLNWQPSDPFIPYGDIMFQGSDGYRLSHNDDIQTTPRSMENNEHKRISVARAVWNGMHVAVKIIVRGSTTQAQRASIVNEVAAVQAIMHPNCIRVFGFTEQPSQHVSLVTEWLQGGSLLDFLASSPPAPEQHRLDIFISVCSAGKSNPPFFSHPPSPPPPSLTHTPHCQWNTCTPQHPQPQARGWRQSTCTSPAPSPSSRLC